MVGRKGRSGRRPTGAVPATGAFNTRLPVELRGRLEASARDNGRSLSAEIRDRLELSFIDPATTHKKAFGEPRVAAMAVLVAEAIRNAEAVAGWQAKWNESPWVWAAARHAVELIFLAYRPEGPTEPPEIVVETANRMRSMSPEIARLASTEPESSASAIALGILDSIARSELPPAIPPKGTHYSDGFYLYPAIRRDLGPPWKSPNKKGGSK